MTERCEANHYTRYDGTRGTLRLFKEVVAEAPGAFRNEVSALMSKLRGDGTVSGEACGIKGCSRDGVAEFAWPDRWRPDTVICRRHWLTFVVVKVVVALAFYGGLLALMAFWLWVVMNA